MELERFRTYAESLRGGCKNHLDWDEGDEDYYRERYNKLTGTLMSITAEHYNDE